MYYPQSVQVTRPRPPPAAPLTLLTAGGLVDTGSWRHPCFLLQKETWRLLTCTWSQPLGHITLPPLGIISELPQGDGWRFCLPWARIILVWEEIWVAPSCLKGWGFRVGELGVPRMKRAQTSLDGELRTVPYRSPSSHPQKPQRGYSQ